MSCNNDVEKAQKKTPLGETANESTSLLNSETKSLEGVASASQPRNLFQHVALSVLTVVAWASGILFSLYIAGHYGGAVVGHDMERWNIHLPHLYDKDELFATIGMGLHLFCGALTMALGSIQFIKPIRRRFPAFHKWTGRIYISCSAITAIGGLMYMARKSTIGGPVMSIGFSISAFLTLICCYQTYKNAVGKNFTQHELWAWRLYSLMISSWLYRIESAGALLLGIPHDAHFRFAFDYVMDFFFYLPNLLVVEILWRLRHHSTKPALWNAVAICMLIAAGVLLITTQVVAMMTWIPGMRGNLKKPPSLEL